jgi:hypothetical protein
MLQVSHPRQAAANSFAKGVRNLREISLEKWGFRAQKNSTIFSKTMSRVVCGGVAARIAFVIVLECDSSVSRQS